MGSQRIGRNDHTLIFIEFPCFIVWKVQGHSIFTQGLFRFLLPQNYNCNVSNIPWKQAVTGKSGMYVYIKRRRRCTSGCFSIHEPWLHNKDPKTQSIAHMSFSNSNMTRRLYVCFEIFYVLRNSRGDATFLSEVYHRQLRKYIQFWLNWLISILTSRSFVF